MDVLRPSQVQPRFALTCSGPASASAATKIDGENLHRDEIHENGSQSTVVNRSATQGSRCMSSLRTNHGNAKYRKQDPTGTEFHWCKSDTEKLISKGQVF